MTRGINAVWKAPFEEVLSDKLFNASSNVKVTDAWIIEARVVLDVLFKGKMPASVAHKIAHDHARLPKLLIGANQKDLAEFAELVLSDLEHRHDENRTGQIVASG